MKPFWFGNCVRRHMNKSHSDERPNTCSDCGKWFSPSQLARAHWSPYRRKSLKVQVLWEKFSKRMWGSRTCLLQAYAWKTPQMAWLRQFAWRAELVDKTHGREKPYQCPHCMYPSPGTMKLKRHMMTHMGSKSSKCELCDTRFTQTNSITVHKKSHDGSKVSKCHLCPCSYISQSNLK